MPKMTNLLGNSEDLISQFMLENDPAANISELKQEADQLKEQVEIARNQDKITSGDSSLKIKQVDNLEDLLRDDEAEPLEDEQPDKKVDEVVKVIKEEKSPKVTEEAAEEVQYDFSSIISYLAQEGIVDVDEDEEFEDSENGLTAAIQTTINRQVESYKRSLPSIVGELADYIEKGGDPRRFMGAVSGPLDLAALDLTREGDQELVVREYLKTQDYDVAEITETIDGYKDGLLLAKQAAIAQKKLAKITEAERQAVIAEQTREAKLKEDTYQNYVSSITKTIKESKSIAGLEIKDKDKDTFQNYLLKIGKDGRTGYQRDLQENMIQSSIDLAYLKFKKYDFSKVAKAAETEATKKIKLSLTKTSDRNPHGSTGLGLGDADETAASKKGDLSGFRGFLK